MARNFSFLTPILSRNRDRYVRYAASGGDKVAHMWHRGNDFSDFCPKILDFHAIFFYCGNALC